MKYSDSFLRKKGFSPEIWISVGLWRRSPKKGRPFHHSFFSGFCDVAKVMIIQKIIWLHNRYAGKKKENPSIFLTTFWKLSQGSGDRKFF